MKVYFDLQKQCITDVDMEGQVIFKGDLTSELQVISNAPTVTQYVVVGAKLSNGREIGPFLYDVDGVNTDAEHTTWNFTLSQENGFTLVAGKTVFYFFLCTTGSGNTPSSKKCLGSAIVTVANTSSVGEHSYFVQISEGENEEDVLDNMKAQIEQLQQLINSVTTIEANPSSQASADLIKIKIGSVTYGVSLVKANPSGTPTNTLLRTISINGVIYSTNGDYPELIVIPNTTYTFGNLIGTEHPYSYACYLTTWEHNGLYHLDYTTQGANATLKITSFKDGFKEYVYEDEALTLWAKTMSNIIAGVGATRVDTLANKQDKITSSNKIGADLVAETTAKQFISASEKGQIATNANNIILLGTSVDATGHKIELAINPTTYVLTLTLKDKNNNTLSTASADLPLETMVVDGTYNDQTKKVVLTLQNGSTIEFSVASLISGLQETLVAGVNIKYINGQNILMGAGDSNDLLLDTVFEYPIANGSEHGYIANPSTEVTRILNNPSSLVIKYTDDNGEVRSLRFDKKYIDTFNCLRYVGEVIRETDPDDSHYQYLYRYVCVVTYSNNLYSYNITTEDVIEAFDGTGINRMFNHVISLSSSATSGTINKNVYTIDNNTILLRDGFYYRRQKDNYWINIQVENTYEIHPRKSFRIQERYIILDISTGAWNYAEREPFYETLIELDGTKTHDELNQLICRTVDEFSILLWNGRGFSFVGYDMSYDPTVYYEKLIFQCISKDANGDTLVEQISYTYNAWEWDYTSYTIPNTNKALYFTGAFDSADGKTRQTGVLYGKDLSNSSVAEYDNITYYKIPKPTGALDYGTYSANFITNKYPKYQGSNWNSTECIGKISGYAEVNYYWVGFTKGTTQAQALADFQDLVLQYKLATPYTDTGIIEGESILPLDSNMANKIRQEVVDGLNLCPNRWINQKAFDGTTGDIVNNNSHSICPDFIEVQPNTIYTVSGTNQYLYLFEYNSSQGFIQFTRSDSGANKLTITTSSTTKYLRVQYQSTTNLDIMLNEGNHAYPYHEWCGEILHEKDITPTLLWENGSPTSAFIPSNSSPISLKDMSGYKYLIFKYKIFRTGNFASKIEKFENMAGGIFHLSFLSMGSSVETRVRYFTRTSDTTMTFDDAYYNGVVNNDSIIPLAIYGTNIL